MSEHSPVTEAVPVDELRALREDSRMFRQLAEAAKTRTLILGKIVIIDGSRLRDSLPVALAETESCTVSLYAPTFPIDVKKPKDAVQNEQEDSHATR